MISISILRVFVTDIRDWRSRLFIVFAHVLVTNVTASTTSQAVAPLAKDSTAPPKRGNTAKKGKNLSNKRRRLAPPANTAIEPDTDTSGYPITVRRATMCPGTSSSHGRFV